MEKLHRQLVPSGKRFVLLLICLFLGSNLLDHAVCRASQMGSMLSPGKSSGHKKTDQLPELPAQLDETKINALVAPLDDDQARQLLIRELKRSADSTQLQGQAKPRGVAGIAQRVATTVALVERRLAELKAGARATPEHLSSAFAAADGGERPHRLLLLFAGFAALAAAGATAARLFRHATADIRRRIGMGEAPTLAIKVRRQSVHALLDLAAFSVFALTTLVVFYLLFDDGAFRRLLILAYLVVVAAVCAVGLVSRFLLAPDAGAVRLLPVNDATARYTHRWIMIISTTCGAGLLLMSLLELERSSEALVVLTGAATGLVVALMIICLLCANRKKVSLRICESAKEDSMGAVLLRSQIAELWLLAAIPYILCCWCLWMFYLLLGRADLVLPLAAILASIPLFLVLNWAGQRLLEAAFGLARKAAVPTQSGRDAAIDETCAPRAEGAPAASQATGMQRLFSIVRRGLSISIAGLIFFWLLLLWGFEVHLEAAVMRATFEIVVVISLAYVAWSLIERYLNRRIERITGVSRAADDDHDMEYAGGGSRVGTLLQLLRKFLLIVLFIMVVLIILAAVGVNIGPLLAGAGIAGIAIGFGTQTLVKDIVSGIFYLIDDAFRIGEYIDTGKAKGTVEHISIRSVRLRHPRGMVQTVPFSALGTITNSSRDYSIEKIEFRVPYDTDVDKVKKIVKKIDAKIQQDEELRSTLLAPIKSQGVKRFDDSGLVMRIKLKTKPGEQFLVRKELFGLLKKAFDESGIEFAKSNLVVQMPQDVAAQAAGKQPEQREAARSAGEPPPAPPEAAPPVAAVAEEGPVPEVKKQDLA